MSRTIHASWDNRGRDGYRERIREERKARAAGRTAAIVADEMTAYEGEGDGSEYFAFQPAPVAVDATVVTTCYACGAIRGERVHTVYVVPGETVPVMEDQTFCRASGKRCQ